MEHLYNKYRTGDYNGEDAVHVCPGISFETMDDAIAWFDGLGTSHRDFVEHLGETLLQFDDGEWGDGDGHPCLPDRWYRDTVHCFSLSDAPTTGDIDAETLERGIMRTNANVAGWVNTYHDTVVPVLLGIEMTHTCRKFKRKLSIGGRRTKCLLDQGKVLKNQRTKMKWILKKREMRKSAEPEPVAKRTRTRTRTPPTTPRIKKTGGIKKKGSSGKKKKKNNYRRR